MSLLSVKNARSGTKRIIGTFAIPATLSVIAILISSGPNPTLSESIITGNEILETDSSSQTALDGVESGESTASNTTDNAVSISDSSVSIRLDGDSKYETNTTESSISIDISTKSNPKADDQPSTTTQPSLVINGEDVVIPKNGRTRQTIKDGDSTTSLRTDIDGEGSSSIRIQSSSN